MSAAVGRTAVALPASPGITSDNSKKQLTTATCARVRETLVVGGRLDKAGQSVDLRMTSITRVFAARAVGNPPACRRAKTRPAGHYGVLSPDRARTPLQSGSEPEAHERRTRARNEAGPVSFKLRDPYADNLIVTGPVTQRFPGLAASSAPGPDPRSLFRRTSWA